MSNQSTKSDDMNDDGMLNAEMQRKLPQGKILQPKLRFKGFADPWQQRKLGELGFTYSGLSGKNKSDFGHGSAYFVTYLNVFSNPIADCYGIEAVEIDDKQHKVITGDIFFTASSETPEDVGMTSLWLGAQDNLYLNSFCFGYRMTANHNSIFMAYSLRSPQFRSKIQLLAQGISRFNISKKKVMELISTFPSLSEQIRIGEFFRVLDDFIAAAKKKADLLKLKKRYYLQAIFSQQLRFKGFTEPWQQRKLGELFKERSERSNQGELISVTITNGVVPASSLERKDNSSEDKSNYKQVKTGDIAYNTMRMWQGASGVSPYSGILSPAYTVLIPSSEVSSSFFAQMFKLVRMLHLFQRYSQGLTSDTWNLKYPLLSEIRVTIPSLAEQERISEFLVLNDELTALVKKKAEDLQKIKSYYLQQLFV
ncbi:Type I restriction-modification system, specificity subunit S [Bifidobacterium pullorum subsp. gallinarum]|uniref:Type I restriction-modification system, specificity subunit S n=2 Tax=Bifidobacterium pullorum TaxID=78448 RepID=A0A087AR42_9BIFI|nr:restriction endonuclease subunit S [Bifidobacterium pullorum]KFI61242.1 Type I restriction-modification system, specificity subunit S [Bifidobacterium pullorum subsp. gallinarum]